MERLLNKNIHCLGNSKYEVLKSVEGFQFQSTLIIRDTASEDFGYYGCAVTNALGSVEASILLEKQGRLPGTPRASFAFIFFNLNVIWIVNIFNISKIVQIV